MQQFDQAEQSSTCCILGEQTFKFSIKLQQTNRELLSVSIIKPLANHLVFLYLTNGEYFLYDLKGDKGAEASLRLQGKIEANLRNIFVVDDTVNERGEQPLLLAYMSLNERALKILDLNQNQIVEGFSPSYPTELILISQSKSEQSAQTILRETQIFTLPGNEDQDHYFLLLMEQPSPQKTTDIAVVFSVLVLTKDLSLITEDYNEPQMTYEYVNLTEQRDIRGQVIDCDTAVFYGQDYEPGKYEFLLIRPLQGLQSFVVIVPLPEPHSFVLFSILPWPEEGKISIWLNSNEQNLSHCVDVLEYEPYFTHTNPNTLRELYKPHRIAYKLDPQSETILSSIYGVHDRYALISCIVGNDNYHKLVDIQKMTVLQQIPQTGHRKVTSSTDGSYYIVSDCSILTIGMAQNDFFYQVLFLPDMNTYLHSYISHTIPQIAEQKGLIHDIIQLMQ